MQKLTLESVLICLGQHSGVHLLLLFYFCLFKDVGTSLTLAVGCNVHNNTVLHNSVY